MQFADNFLLMVSVKGTIIFSFFHRMAGWLCFFFAGLSLGISPAFCLSPEGQGSGASPYLAFFTEETITVSRERDGILPGTLRTALIQASEIRAQSSFTLVKIVFAPQIKRIQITKGPLPEIDGSLTTVDCHSPQGRVVIEWLSNLDSAGENPSEEGAGFKLTSNGNTIRECHLTGFPGDGILIRGNRNLVEQNLIGFHPEVPESQVAESALYQAPKTNGGAGIRLDRGASENLIQNNDIVANTYHGVFMGEGIGTGNRIFYNFFAKNSGQPIKVVTSGNATLTPSISSITRVGETYLIEGTAPSRSTLQIYSIKNKEEIGMLVTETDTSSNSGNKFTIATKSKGFVENETQLVALATGLHQNSSEFSGPFKIGSSTPPEAPAIEPPTGADTPEVHAAGSTEENNSGLAEPPVPEAQVKSAEPPAVEGAPSQGTTMDPQAEEVEPETVIDIHGQGAGEGEAEVGDGAAKQEVTSMGI